MSFQQYIFITGGVGVGKSTLITNLKQSIPKEERIVIKEYIDFEPELGKKMLEETLQQKGNIYDFQLFILDFFDRQLQKIGNKKYIIFERSPYDSVIIFSTEAYLQGRMSKEQLDQLKQHVENICKKYHIPPFEECIFNRIDSCQYDVQHLYHHVKCLVDESRKKELNVCFFLYCSDPYKQKENIEKRGRPEERNYDMNYMININQKYESIFSPYF